MADLQLDDRSRPIIPDDAPTARIGERMMFRHIVTDDYGDIMVMMTRADDNDPISYVTIQADLVQRLNDWRVSGYPDGVSI